MVLSETYSRGATNGSGISASAGISGAFLPASMASLTFSFHCLLAALALSILLSCARRSSPMRCFRLRSTLASARCVTSLDDFASGAKAIKADEAKVKTILDPRDHVGAP